MSIKPYYTSVDLIEAVKRKIMFPVSQSTFTDEDILKFANEEMFISQVPTILMHHEEFFVTYKVVPLKPNTSRYPIPSRAIGMKLRDLMWRDTNGTLYEMTRINADNKTQYQRGLGVNEAIHKFYLEGNDVVLIPPVSSSISGSLVMFFFIRPNQLVLNDRAAFIKGFEKTITINNTSLNPGDTLIIGGYIFKATNSAIPASNEFQIGTTSVDTANNIVNLLNNFNELDIIANNNGGSSNIITISFSDLSIAMFQNSPYFETEISSNIFSNNNSGIVITDDITIVFDNIPPHIGNGSVIDFLETEGGHKIKGYDVKIGQNAISGNKITFTLQQVSISLVVGDYICLANECIIPQIPSDLHNALAERTCARILAAIGDQQGLQVNMAKIAEINQSQSYLIDNRVEGAPIKINTKNSPLYWNKRITRRRLF
jgi:hypothetical protein